MFALLNCLGHVHEFAFLAFTAAELQGALLCENIFFRGLHSRTASDSVKNEITSSSFTPSSSEPSEWERFKLLNFPFLSQLEIR